MILGVVRNTVSILDCCRPVIFILDVVFECRSQFLFETNTKSKYIQTGKFEFWRVCHVNVNGIEYPEL